MREGIEVVAEAMVRRWSIDRTLELRTAEVVLVRAFLRESGVGVRELSGGRFEVESAGTRAACDATQLLLMGLRHLLEARRAAVSR
jgi:hypothetical protein